MTRQTSRLLSGLVASTFVCACASQASLVRPKESSAGDATGERACDPKRVGGDNEPFAVDWSDQNRASLESAMQRGVAVVKYSCEGVEVLKGCSVVGDYAYRGISKKTKVVQMKDLSSVSANLGSVSLPVAVQAELKQGKGLDLAYVMVGNESTTVQTVSRDMLRGRCDGATHFVYEASLGAFALDTNVSGEARGAAQVFGQGGVATGAESSKSTRTTDGDVQACDKATDEGRAKTDGCKALVRVTLFAIVGEKAAAAGPGIAAPDARSCPAGFTYVDGACERSAKASLCAPNDVAGCRAQCLAGSPESCGRFSSALLETSFTPGFVVKQAERDKMKATLTGTDDQLRAACDKGEGAACTMSAFAAMAKHPEADFLPEGVDVPAFVPAVVKGCKAGDSVGCYMTLLVYGDGLLEREKVNPVPRDNVKMLDIVGIGCDRGNATACLMLVPQLLTDERALPTPEARGAAALKYAKRACTGGLKEGCGAAGALQLPTAQCKATFEEMRVELREGNEIYRALGTAGDDCAVAASVVDPVGAKEMFALGCQRGHGVSCAKK